MNDQGTYKVKDFDESLPDRIVLSIYESAILDMGIMMNKAHTANKLGLAHEVLPPARHLLKFGVPSAPIPEPGKFAGNAVQMRNHQRTVEAHGIQEKFSPILRNATVSGLPARIIRLAEVDGSIRHHEHIYDIFATLSEHMYNRYFPYINYNGFCPGTYSLFWYLFIQLYLIVRRKYILYT